MARKNNMLSESEISYFCQQINMIIKAGLPTYYGISILRDSAANAASKALLSKIYNAMEQGATLYEALSQTKAFPSYMLHMIHVGEQSGRLEEVLDALSVYYERTAEVRQAVKHAVTYPLIMTVMMLAVIIVIITNVIPIFADVYAQLGSGLVGGAKLLMDISIFLNKYLLMFIIAFAILVLLFVCVPNPIKKKLLEHNGIAQSLAASRFANCMYLSLASGLDTDQGLHLAEQLVENTIMEKRIQECRKHLSNGESFASSLLLSGVFSEMYSSLITIGYKTSAMDDVMLRISKAYEDETNEKLHRFVSILEPSLIIILSFFIGLILISFLLPLLGIMSSIG